MSSTKTPNMMLTLPTVGSEAGPLYAQDINGSLTQLDAHSHIPGSGVQITTAAININADLTFAGFKATNVAALTLVTQTTAPTTSGSVYSKLGAEPVALNDLWYFDGTNNIQVTAGGQVNATIASLPGESYNAGVFSWKQGSGSTTPANFDIGSITIRPNVASTTYGVTITPPSTIASSYAIAMPSIPAATSVVTLDTSGNLATVSTNNFVPSGVVSSYIGTVAPSGYLMCDGTAYSRTTYSALFAVVGTAFGVGDGSTTFNVPDMRGMFLRGVSGSSGNDPDAAGRYATNSGNSGNAVGSGQASQYTYHNHAVIDPGHHHAVQFVNDTGSSAAGSNFGPVVDTSSSTNTTSAGTGIGIQANGGSETRPINVYVNYIVKT